MTIIEIFDSEMFNNIISSLVIKNDRVVYITEESKDISKHIEDFHHLFEMRNEKIDIDVIKVRYDSFQSVYESIENELLKLIEIDDDIIFNVNGGKDIILICIGMLKVKYQFKLFYIDKDSNKICFENEEEINNYLIGNDVKLSVRENIILNGGDIVDYINETNEMFHWNFTKGFVDDINTMWLIYQKNIEIWNREIGFMQQFFDKETGKLYGKANSIMDTLVDYKILKKEEDKVFSFKNRQIREFLMKVGNLLELFVCTSASVIRDDSGKKFFDDVRVGVNIDWDGIYHDVKNEIKDTKNEIDVILMKNNIPVFISCKSGDLNTEELYKLHTVAERFGGNRAKKVLLISDFSKKGASRSYFLQRAIDMGIYVETDVHNYSKETMMEFLVGIFNN